MAIKCQDHASRWWHARLLLAAWLVWATLAHGSLAAQHAQLAQWSSCPFAHAAEGEEIEALWHEYEQGQSPEARLVKDFDKVGQGMGGMVLGWPVAERGHACICVGLWACLLRYAHAFPPVNLLAELTHLS